VSRFRWRSPRRSRRARSRNRRGSRSSSIEPKVWRLEADGSAVVAFTVRANGRIDDAVTLAATERRLGDAAVEAIEQWRFERDPALGTGPNAVPSAVLRREIVEFVFKRDSGVISMSHLEAAKSWFPKDPTLDVRMLLPDELDAPLVRVQTTESPGAPALRVPLTVGGRVTLSFVVDETGRVRVPAIVAADDPALGAAALAMLASWRYERRCAAASRRSSSSATRSRFRRGASEPLEPARHHNRAPRSRNALPMTDTDDRLIARLAMTGDNNQPNVGYSTPAASGRPSAL
jgi:TonB family protein